MRSARRLSAPQIDSGRPGLASVSGQTQAMVGGVGVDAAEKFRRSLYLVAANADSNNMAVVVSRRQFENFLRFLDSEVAGCVENPEQRHAEIASAAGTSALQALEDRGEILLAKETDADGNIDLGVQHILFFQALHEPVGDEFVVVGAAKVCADSLECHQETLKIGVAVKGLTSASVARSPWRLRSSSRVAGSTAPSRCRCSSALGSWRMKAFGGRAGYGSHLVDCSFLTQDLRERYEASPTG